MSRRSAIVTSSVITAAFIGPGTVTTCAKAGAHVGMALLWALAFSVVACLVLQEAAARVQVVTGRPLGHALRTRSGGHPGLLAWLAAVAVLAGCAAYESGNILGAVAGLQMLLDGPPPLLAALLSLAAGVLLFAGSTRTVVWVLSILVAFMSVVFVGAAILIAPAPLELLSGLVPRLPTGSFLLALALVGTTVVPYNLFLGSALASGHSLRDLRLGLAVAILGGGLASAAIMVAGSDQAGSFSLEAVATTLGERVAPWTSYAFALGLAAAGLTSAITAPLAAALTARSVFAAPDDFDACWAERSWRFRAVWIGVLLCGAVFGIAQVKPVPAIVFAQALNGIFLPVVAIALWRVVNDRNLLGSETNGRRANLLTGLIVLVTVVLGASGVWKALSSLLP